MEEREGKPGEKYMMRRGFQVRGGVSECGTVVEETTIETDGEDGYR